METILITMYQWILLFASSYLVYATILEVGGIQRMMSVNAGRCNFVSYRKPRAGTEKKGKDSSPLMVTAAWGKKPDTHSGGGRQDSSSGRSNTEKGSKRERNNEDQDSGRNGKENNEERRRTIQSNLKQPVDEGQCKCWEASKHEKQCSGMKILDAHGGYLSQFCKGCTNIVWGCRVCKCACDPCKKEDYIPPGQAPPTNLEETRQGGTKAAKEAAAETKEGGAIFWGGDGTTVGSRYDKPKQCHPWSIQHVLHRWIQFERLRRSG